MGAAADCDVNAYAANGGSAPSKKVAQASRPSYEQLFSEEAQKRTMPELRVLATAFKNTPGILPVNAGLPPADAFPLESIQVNLKGGSSVTISGDDLEAAQQYNLSLNGHPTLLEFVGEHMQRVHAPPPGHQTIITAGSNATLDIIFRMFMNSGDYLLTEEFTYPHVPESMLDPYNFKTLPIKLDSEGIIPESLEEILSKRQAQSLPMPKLLYTVPVGQNPTGALTSLQRKEQVYALCRRFNIVIMEDDPYYYLQFQAGEKPKGLQNLCPSYLSMDVDNRVIRLDSFSKILIPGTRLGWVTAHPAVIEKFIYHFHGIAMGPASMSQVLMSAMLNTMGHDGFENHLKTVQAKYIKKAEAIQRAAEKYLTGLADWTPICSGMFFWVNIKGVTNIEDIQPALQAAKVILVPGRLALHSFPHTEGIDCSKVRLSFVTASEEQLEEAVKRIADVIRDHTKLQSS